MNRKLLAIGMTLVAAGLVLGAAHTGAFDRVSADRDISVAVADDSEAYLATEVTYGGNTVRNYICFIICIEYDLSREVASVQSRYNETFSTVTYEVASVEGAANGTLEVSGDPDQLDPGQTGQVVLACSGEETVSGTGDVRLQTEATGAIEIYDASVVVQDVEYNCDASV